MRKLLCCLVLVAGCSPGPEGPEGPAGPQGEKGDPGPMGEMGKDGVTPKVPHLIVAMTGEDLGVYVEGETAWSDKLKAVVSYEPINTTVLFAESDCKGAMAAQGVTLFRGAYFVAPARGTLVTIPSAQPVKFHAASRVDALPGGCTPFDQPTDQMAEPLTDSGIAARTYRADELAIDLR